MANVLQVKVLWVEAQLCLVPGNNAVFYLEFNPWEFRCGPLPVHSIVQHVMLNFKSLFNIAGLLTTNFPVLDILSHHWSE